LDVRGDEALEGKPEVDERKRKKAERDEKGKDFNELTEAANFLLESGQFSVYQDTFEKIEILTQHHREKIAKAKEEEDHGDLQWEYKWNSADPKTHGPYPGTSMQQWRDSTYFNSGTVVCRRIGSEKWLKALEVTAFNRNVAENTGPTKKMKLHNLQQNNK